MIEKCMSFFKGDLRKIYESPHEIDSSCNLEMFKMFATMMRDKFTDDDFLIGKIFLIVIA